MRIDVGTEDREVMDLLMQAKAKIGDMTPVMAEIGEIVRRSIQKTLDAGGRPASWQDSKRVRADGGETLKLTGRLKNSITVLTAKKDAVAVGTNVIYARVLHFGAKKGSFGEHTAHVPAHDRQIVRAFGRLLKSPKTVQVRAHDRKQKLPWGDIPARPFMMIQDEDWTEINKTLIRYIEM